MDVSTVLCYILQWTGLGEKSVVGTPSAGTELVVLFPFPHGLSPRQIVCLYRIYIYIYILYIHSITLVPERRKLCKTLEPDAQI